MVFDICGAPFGTGFFVSWRLGELPPASNLAAYAALALGISVAMCLGLQERLPGVVYGLVVAFMVGLLAFIALRSALDCGIADLDSILLRVPILGTAYERHIRAMTYYRIDLMLMYQEAVHAAISQVIDELMKAQGIPPLSEFERKPTLKDFSKR